MAKTITVTLDSIHISAGNVTIEIVQGKSIRIRGTYKNHVNGPQAFDRTFSVGDSAERDSFNLTYTGKITAIGAKTVTIKDDCLTDRTSRLTLPVFVWRNWDFDAAKSTKRNAEWMD